MNYSAELTARLIIDYSIHIGKPVTNIRLQALIYYVQVASIVETGEPFFSDQIVAWKPGPAVKSVFYKYRPHASYELKNWEKITEEEIPTNQELQLLIDVVESYKKYSGSSMRYKSRQEKPWIEAFQSYQEGKSVMIPEDSIREYYRSNPDLIYGIQTDLPEWKFNIDIAKQYPRKSFDQI